MSIKKSLSMMGNKSAKGIPKARYDLNKDSHPNVIKVNGFNIPYSVCEQGIKTYHLPNYESTLSLIDVEFYTEKLEAYYKTFNTSKKSSLKSDLEKIDKHFHSLCRNCKEVI